MTLGSVAWSVVTGCSLPVCGCVALSWRRILSCQIIGSHQAFLLLWRFVFPKVALQAEELQLECALAWACWGMYRAFGVLWHGLSLTLMQFHFPLTLFRCVRKDIRYQKTKFQTVGQQLSPSSNPAWRENMTKKYRTNWFYLLANVSK